MTLESRNKEKIWKDKPIGFESDDTSAWVTSTEALHATIDLARDLGGRPAVKGSLSLIAVAGATVAGLPSLLKRRRREPNRR